MKAFNVQAKPFRELFLNMGSSCVSAVATHGGCHSAASAASKLMLRGVRAVFAVFTAELALNR